MLLEYIAIAIMIIVATLIAAIAIGLGELLGPKKKTKVKSEAYESGIPAIGPGTRRMPVRFYLIAVLFILFDIEVVFLLPWAVSFRFLGVPGLVLILIFVVILEVAHLYAWKKGALEWD